MVIIARKQSLISFYVRSSWLRNQGLHHNLVTLMCYSLESVFCMFFLFQARTFTLISRFYLRTQCTYCNCLNLLLAVYWIYWWKWALFVRSWWYFSSKMIDCGLFFFMNIHWNWAICVCIGRDFLDADGEDEMTYILVFSAQQWLNFEVNFIDFSCALQSGVIIDVIRHRRLLNCSNLHYDYYSLTVVSSNDSVFVT